LGQTQEKLKRKAFLQAQTVLRSAADGSVLCVMETADVSALSRLAPGWRPATPFEGVADDGTTPLFGLIWYAKNGSFEPFIHKTDRFAKTGSGQT
jgi:hypothetical protein